jgi:hypothetical protein
LNTLGVFMISVGIVFLVYSVITRKKVNIYNRGDSKIILNEHKFLRLQLYISILNSAYLIVFGFIVIEYNLINVYIALSPLLFHFINYLVILIGKAKQYIR